ncbi:MAG: hypothetical protein ABIL40_02310 [candidate division WOR-3 bacterium]
MLGYQNIRISVGRTSGYQSIGEKSGLKEWFIFIIMFYQKNGSRMSKKLFICLMLFFGFVFGNQASHNFILKEQSVFIPDWRGKIVKPNALYFNNFFLTDAENSDLTNYSIKQKKSQSDASRITFGKIALEASSGLVCGVFITYFTYKIGGHSSWWPMWGYGLGFSLGPAIGVTLIGNTLTEPNGSFVKSLIGSSTGSILGGVALYTTLWLIGMSHDPNANLTPLYIITGISVSFPVIGAVIGYNLRGSGCCLLGAKEVQNFKTESGQLDKAMFKIQIVSIKF